MWLITGAGGQLGSVLLRALTNSGESVVGTVSPNGPRPQYGETVPLDLANFEAIRAFVRDRKPKYVIHTAAVTSVMAAYENPTQARKINVEATVALAEATADVDARLVFTSTDLVFDGSSAPYDESATPHPTSVYGKTKIEAEEQLANFTNAAVVRLPLMVGLPAVDRKTTFRNQLQALLDRKPLKLFQDEFRSPIALTDAAQACIDVAKSNFAGVIHAGGPQSVSRLEIGLALARALGINADQVVPSCQSDMQFPEPRPMDVSLDSTLFEKTFGRAAGRNIDDVMADVANEIDAGN